MDTEESVTLFKYLINIQCGLYPHPAWMFSLGTHFFILFHAVDPYNTRQFH